MDNDALINQARALYAALSKKQCRDEVAKKPRLLRLDRLIKLAYWRYLRRLNRCVLCYRYRTKECERDGPKDCNRELWRMSGESERSD